MSVLAAVAAVSPPVVPVPQWYQIAPTRVLWRNAGGSQFYKAAPWEHRGASFQFTTAEFPEPVGRVRLTVRNDGRDVPQVLEGYSPDIRAEVGTGQTVELVAALSSPRSHVRQFSLGGAGTWTTFAIIGEVYK